MRYLLDTNVISELRKPKPNSDVVRFIAGLPLRDLFLSVVSLAEIRFGILCGVRQDQRERLEYWLGNSIRPMFEPDRVLPVTEAILVRWRVLMEAGRKSGHTFSQPDLLIAATAAEHQLTVVSRDSLHYLRAWLNPWTREDPSKQGT